MSIMGKKLNERLPVAVVLLLFVLATLFINISFPITARADSIIYVAATTAALSATNTITVNVPTGTQSGDVMIAVVAKSANTATFSSSGWTAITISNFNSNNGTVESMYHVAGGSEPASYTFTATGGNSRLVGSITTYRGVNNTTPIDATSTSSSGSGTSLTQTSFTTATAQSKVLAVYGANAANPAIVTFTPPSSPLMTERVDIDSSQVGNSDVSIALDDYHKSTAGSFAPNAAIGSVTSNWGSHQLSLKPNGVQHLMLFWDGSGAAPTGWSYVTEAEGRFVRGESPANYGSIGGDGTRPFTPTQTYTVGTPSIVADNGANGGDTSTTTHTHAAASVTVGADSNGDLPAYRNLRLIRYDAGIPTTIPSGAIALFSGAATGSFSRYTAQDNAMVRIDSTATGTGGADSVTNQVCGATQSPCAVINLPAASGAGQVNSTSAATNTASATHTHTVTGGTASSATPSGAAGNADPPYVQPLLYKATANTTILSLNLTAMFDGDPGSGWGIISANPGDTYYQNFLRPNSAGTFNGTAVGQASHANVYAATSSAATPNGTLTFSTGANNNLAGAAHTHASTFTLTSQSNIPPYFNVVIAQKVNYVLSQYQWYVDTASENVTNPWPSSAVDIGPNSQIPAVPAAYGPPINVDNLRIRVQITVTGQNVLINTVSFKLQYAVGSAAGDCSSGSWQDVAANASTTRPWRYGANSAPADGSALVTNKLASTRLENFYKSASTGSGFTNPVAATAGDTIEYDWLMQDYQATGSTVYNFRVVENNGVADSGTLLTIYSTCPSLVTRPTTDQVLRHGEFFQEEIEKGFEWAD